MSLKSALDKIQKKINNDDFVLDYNKKAESISSGSLLLDNITGGGLLFKGRICEISGAESSGKTTLCLQSTAQALKKNKTVVFFDFEQTFDSIYAKSLGIDIKSDNFAVLQPLNLEEGVEALRILEKELPDNGESVIIIDSIAAAKPRKLLEQAGDQQQIGLHAQRIGELTGYINSEWCGRKKAYVLVTNQIRRVPSAGGMFQSRAVKSSGLGFGASNDDSYTTTGGAQLRYLLSVRVLLDYQGKIEEGSYDKGNLKRTGNYIKAFVIKNKICPPFQSAKLAIVYGKGTDDSFSMVEVLKEYGVIKSSGSKFFYEDFEQNEDGKGLSFSCIGKDKFYEKLNTTEYKEDMRKTYIDIMQNESANTEIGDQEDVNDDDFFEDEEIKDGK